MNKENLLVKLVKLGALIGVGGGIAYRLILVIIKVVQGW